MTIALNLELLDPYERSIGKPLIKNKTFDEAQKSKENVHMHSLILEILRSCFSSSVFLSISPPYSLLI